MFKIARGIVVKVSVMMYTMAFAIDSWVVILKIRAVMIAVITTLILRSSQ